MAPKDLPNPSKMAPNLFTDGSKTEEGVAVAAVSTKHVCKPYTCQLLDKRELWAFLLAFRHAYHSKQKSFLILSDSLLSLQAIFNLKYNHSVLIKKIRTGINQRWEGDCFYLESRPCGYIFIWIPGHVGIRGNSAADFAAKDVCYSFLFIEGRGATNVYHMRLATSEQLYDTFYFFGLILFR